MSPGAGGQENQIPDTFTKVNGEWRILDREVWRLGKEKKLPDCPTKISSLN